MVLICSRFLPSVEMTLLAVFQRSPNKKLVYPGMLKLTEKVKIERDRELDKTFMEEGMFKSPLKVRLKNGKDYEITSTCKGFSHNPLTEGETDHKFDALTSGVHNEEKRAQIKRELKNLEEIKSISALIRNW